MLNDRRGTLCAETYQSKIVVKLQVVQDKIEIGVPVGPSHSNFNRSIPIKRPAGAEAVSGIGWKKVVIHLTQLCPNFLISK